MYLAKYEVRFSDVDAARILYYPRFFYFCHQAFEDFFNEKSPWRYSFLISEKNIGFPTVHVNADYKKPILFGEVAQVFLAIKKIGNSSLACTYKIYTSSKEDVCFSAEVITACTDLLQKRSIPIPTDIREFLEKSLL